ncbi:GNAT family N-acetyltransferase [Peloplasma aerotolerans]|jgi:ribosomal protein S18 acetylase RimI-like enzyme|uniref:GNAT family N-acetyltransferase n=1 Tax=Peloplasma aerotolerans TaxID=3044389 RepID=A0AAW6UA95_9MOLU|nr:GNAT family N-acetyltransferase [Mariniplasma sp. M4Ah]MDI6453635.1 GNAT family N-acetyltransferase [Mariniplasma sp. M4Ah]
MKIVELSKSEYKGYQLEYVYQTKAYYDISIKKRKKITITIHRKKVFKKIEKTFDAKLFEDYIEYPKAFAVFDRKKIVAVIEGAMESWNKRFRVWNFLVEKKYRKQGIGSELFQYIMQYAKNEGARAIILEVQSCNDPAIQFYMKQGLHFVGLDTISYTNNDIQNKEVRLEMARRLE